MELEKRNKKIQSTVKSSKKYAKGKSNFTIFESKSCLDIGGFLGKEAECLKSKSETAHADESPTLQRDEVKSHFYSVFEFVIVAIMCCKFILKYNSSVILCLRNALLGKCRCSSLFTSTNFKVENGYSD